MHIFKLHGFPRQIFQYVSQSLSLVSMTRCSHTFYGEEECQDYSWRSQICNMVGTVWEFLIFLLLVGSQCQISSRKKNFHPELKQLSHSFILETYLWPTEAGGNSSVSLVPTKTSEKHELSDG